MVLVILSQLYLYLHLHAKQVESSTMPNVIHYYPSAIIGLLQEVGSSILSYCIFPPYLPINQLLYCVDEITSSSALLYGLEQLCT